MSPSSPTSPPDSPSPSSYRITPAQSVGSSSTESEVSAYTVATTVSLGNDKPEMEPSGPPAVQFPSEQTQEVETELNKGTPAKRAKRKISLMNFGSKDKNKSGRGSRISRDTKAQLTNQQNSEEEEEVVISITSSQYPEKDIASSREQEPASPASTAEFGSLTVPSRASYHDRPDSLYSDSISRTPSPSRSNFSLSNSPNSSRASFNTQQSQSRPTPSKSPSPSSASSPLTKNEKRSSKSSFRSLFSSFSKKKKHRRDESEVQLDDSVLEILDIKPETNNPPRKPMIQARMERSPRARKAWNFDNDDDELEPRTSPNPRPAVAETSNPPEEPKLPEESVSSHLPDEKDSVLDPEMSRQSFEEPLQQPPSSDFSEKNLDLASPAEKSDQAPVPEDISSGESSAPSIPRSSSPDTLQSEVMTMPPPPSAPPPRRERVRRTVRISSSKPGAIFSEPPQFRLPELSSPSVSTQMPAGVRRVLERTLWKVKAAKAGGSPNSNMNTTPIPPSAGFNAAMRVLSSNRPGNSTSLPVTAIQPSPAYPRSVAPLPLFSEGEEENGSAKKFAVFDQCRSLEISVHRLRIIQRIRTRIDGGMVPQDEIELEKYPDTTSAPSVATGNDAWSGVKEGMTKAEIARKMREDLEKMGVWGKGFMDDYRPSPSAAPRRSFTDPLLGGEASDVATSDTLSEKDALGNWSGSLKPTKAYTIPQHRKPLPPPPVKSTNSRLRLIPPHADPCALGVWGGRKPFYERCAVWIPFDTEEEDAFESGRADLSAKLGGLCGLKVAQFQVETGGRDGLTLPQPLREGFTGRIKWSISLVTRPQGEVHPTSAPGKPNPEDDSPPAAMLETTEEEPSSGKRKNSSSKLESVSLPPSPNHVQPTKNRNASLPGKTDPSQAEDDVLEVLDLKCGEGQPELEDQSSCAAGQEKQESDNQATKAASSSVRILHRAQSHTLLRSGSMSPLNSDGRKSTPLLPSPNSLKRDESLSQHSLRHKSSMSGTWRYQVQPPIDSRGHARGQSAQLGVRNWQRPNPSPPPSPIRNGLMRGLPPSPVNQHGQPISRLQVKKTGQPRPLFLPQHVKHASVSGSGHSTQLHSMGNRNQSSHNFQSSLPHRGGSLRTGSRPAPVDGTRPSLIPRASAPVLSSGSS